MEAGAVPSVVRMVGGGGAGSRHEVDFLISITFKWHIICLRHNIYVGCVAIELYVHTYIPGAVLCRNLCSLRCRRRRANERGLCLTRDKGAEGGGGASDSHL